MIWELMAIATVTPVILLTIFSIIAPFYVWFKK